jgi:hypothetical protein
VTELVAKLAEATERAVEAKLTGRRSRRNPDDYEDDRSDTV